MKKLLSILDAINNTVVDAHAAVLSSPYFLYFCWLIDLIELPGVIQAHNLITWCIYISQTVIQLVALPSLGAKQNREGAKADKIQERIDHHATVAAKDAEHIKSKLDELSKKIGN